MRVVADTHALHWFLTGSRKLSEAAKVALTAAEADPTGGVMVSVATRVDLHYLSATGRVDRGLAHRIWSVVHAAEFNMHAVAVTVPIVEHFGDESLSGLRDPWDRLIVSTAVVLNCPLVSADRAIAGLDLGPKVIW